MSFFSRWRYEPTTVEIGLAFEDYCARRLFSNFASVEPHVVCEYCVGGEERSHNVDFVLIDGADQCAYVECKWNHTNPHSEEYRFYKDLSNTADVYYLTGVGEDPGNPDKLFLLSFKDIHQMRISADSTSANRIRKAPINDVNELRRLSRSHPGSVYPPDFNW